MTDLQEAIIAVAKEIPDHKRTLSAVKRGIYLLNYHATKQAVSYNLKKFKIPFVNPNLGYVQKKAQTEDLLIKLENIIGKDCADANKLAILYNGIAETNYEGYGIRELLVKHPERFKKIMRAPYKEQLLPNAHKTASNALCDYSTEQIEQELIRRREPLSALNIGDDVWFTIHRAMRFEGRDEESQYPYKFRNGMGGVVRVNGHGVDERGNKSIRLPGDPDVDKINQILRGGDNDRH